MLNKVNWLLILILLLSIAGCTSAGTEPGDAPSGDTGEQIATDALPAARQALADYLGIATDTLELDQIADAEWSDSCLGLGGPAESCAAVVTPGYAITFNVAGEAYTVRTNRDGTQARPEAAAGEALPPAVEAARTELARQLGIGLAAVELVSFDQRNWSDSCLGLGGAAEICAAVITPGWEVILMAEGQQYAARTDFEGIQVQIVAESVGEPTSDVPAPDLDGAVVFFQRSGGLASELLTVRIYPDGTIERALGKPGSDMPTETNIIDPGAVDLLIANLEEAGYFSLARTYLPEDSCCDRYLYLISVQGEGNIQTVEALEATGEAPKALWQSVKLLETVISSAFNS